MSEGLRRDVLLTIAAVALTVVLVKVAVTMSPIIALAAAIAIVTFVTLGMDRTGLLCLMGSFATAPMGRGIDSLSGHVATPTELLLVAGLVLSLPGLAQRHKLGLPPLWIGSILVLIAMTLIGSLVTDTAFLSIFSLVRWMAYIALLPMVIAWMRPPRRIIVTLLWSYIAGHMVSTGYGILEGPAAGTNRYDGLTIHPNAFGLAGLVTIAICFYLYDVHRELFVRGMLIGVGLVAALSIWESGSRAALAVALVLIVMLPLVERSALSSVGVACFGVAGLAALPLAAKIAGKGSALSRLLGDDDTAAVADDVRSDALQYGIDKFLAHPILGGGLVDVEVIHNVYVEVAVAAGVPGLVAYACLLFTLARGLFGNHPERRLAWIVWAAIGVAAALPGLWDSTIWVPASLAILPALKAVEETPEAPGPQQPAAPATRRPRLADV